MRSVSQIIAKVSNRDCSLRRERSMNASFGKRKREEQVNESMKFDAANDLVGE